MAESLAARLVLSESDRKTLEGWLRKRGTVPALALRARVVLACAEPEGSSDRLIAERLGVSRPTVLKWRRRFLEHGLAGLRDASRAGAPRSIPDAQVERVIATTLQTPPPAGAPRWSTRLLAARLGMSQTAVSRIWRAFGLAPHRDETFPLSPHLQGLDPAHAIAGLYWDPLDRALALHVDPHASIPPSAAVVLPRRPEQPASAAHDDPCPGLCDLLVALDLQSGAVPGATRRRHRSADFRQFLVTVERLTPPQFELHLVLDNSNCSGTPPVRRWLERHPRVHLHTAPTPASWLKRVTGWFRLLAARHPGRSGFGSAPTLELALRACIAGNGVHPVPFAWTRTPGERPEPAAVFRERISGAPLEAWRTAPGERRALAAFPDETALEAAQRRVVQGEACVARQAAVVARLACSGRDTKEAEALLAQFEDLLVLAHQGLARRKAQAGFSNPPWNGGPSGGRPA